MITLKNINKTYTVAGTAYPAIADISLTVEAGEIFGIIGKSGAGKSTLVRCLNGLEKISSGDIQIAGQSIAGLSDSALRQTRRSIGMIFQHFNLLSSRTAFDNIALPLELVGKSQQAITSRVNDLLRLVELEGLGGAYPHELSGGQKQRVAIARALATEPKVLLCDEATSALDPETTVAILSLLKKINQTLGITVVLITHEMDVVKQICHRVAVLDQGRLAELGKVVDVFIRPQSEVAKRLTQASLHLELPDSIKARLHTEKVGHPIVRLAFVGASAEVPVTTLLHDRFSVTCNILQADLQVIDGDSVGFMVCELQGTQEQSDAALAHLQAEGINVEVLAYVA